VIIHKNISPNFGYKLNTKVKSNEASFSQNLAILGHLFHLTNTCKNKIKLIYKKFLGKNH
jgi:isocitrate lyase